MRLLRAKFHVWRIRLARWSLQASAKLATTAARLLKR